MGTEEAGREAGRGVLPEGRPLLIARPAVRWSGAGRAGAAVRDVLRQRGIAHDMVTAGPGVGEEHARQALEAGERFLVAVGDDRLVREVVAGMMSAGREAPEATLAVLAGGFGCDFVRTFGLPGDAAAGADRLLTGVSYPIDVIRVRCRTPGGEERVTHFAGVAEIGLGGSVQRLASRLPRRLGRARFFSAFWWAQVGFRIPEMRLRGDIREYRGRVHDVILGNAQFAHGGIPVSPRSFPGDGILDVLVMRGPRSDQFTLLPRMFRGEHVPHPNVVELRVRERLSIDTDRPVWVQADTEPLGLTPATFEVLPEALRLKV
jgi:diacylglycerol kinase family enzyme